MSDLKKLLESLLEIEEGSSEKPCADKGATECDCMSYDCTVCYPDEPIKEADGDEDSEEYGIDDTFSPDDDIEYDDASDDSLEYDLDDVADDTMGLPVTATDVTVPAEDVSDLIAQIEYVQDLGISNSAETFRTSELESMSPEMVRRVYNSVVNGEEFIRESSSCIVDNRSDGMTFVTHGHRKVKIAPIAGGFQVLQLSGKLIDQATTREEAVAIAKDFLQSPITESKITFNSIDDAIEAVSLVKQYGYSGFQQVGNVLEINAPELVVNRIADEFDGSVEYSVEENTAGSVAMAMGEDERIDELDHESFKTDEKLSELRDAIDKNVLVSVAFVKKDGSVRHMTIRSSLASYVHSDKPKTDAQLNVERNHNLKRVVDINAYIKALKANKALGMDEPDAKAAASKVAWRSINLQDVLGFMARGKFIDLRDENQIKQRHGDDVYNSLTSAMKNAMSQDQTVTEDFLVEYFKEDQGAAK